MHARASAHVKPDWTKQPWEEKQQDLEERLEQKEARKED